MGGEVVRAEVGLDFDDAAGLLATVGEAADEAFADKVGGYLEGVAGVPVEGKDELDRTSLAAARRRRALRRRFSR